MRWIVSAAFTSAVLLAWLWSPTMTSTAAAEAAAKQEPAAQQEPPADDQETIGEAEPTEEVPNENEPAEGASTEEASTGSEEPRDEPKSEGLEVFVPTEKLPAGSSVSFPVDI